MTSYDVTPPPAFGDAGPARSSDRHSMSLKVKESHLTEMSDSSESLEFIGRGRSPQRGKEASFYDAKRVERCFFSRRGGHRPEEEWAFYWQKKPPFSGPSGDPEKVMPKSPQRAQTCRSNETTAVCHFGPTQFKSKLARFGEPRTAAEYPDRGRPSWEWLASGLRRMRKISARRRLRRGKST